MLKHITFISPNAAELVEMAAAVRRRQEIGMHQRYKNAVAIRSYTGRQSARQTIGQLLPGLQTLLEVSCDALWHVACGVSIMIWSKVHSIGFKVLNISRNPRDRSERSKEADECRGALFQILGYVLYFCLPCRPRMLRWMEKFIQA